MILLTVSGNYGLPLCGRSFWEPCLSWGFLLTPEDSLCLLLPEAFCKSAQCSFSFSHTAILCTYQFEIIHRVIVGFGGCHCRLAYWSESNLRASLAHYGVLGVTEWSIVCLLNKVRGGLISISWIRQLRGHWWPQKTSGLLPMVVQTGTCTQVLDWCGWLDGILPTVHSLSNTLCHVCFCPVEGCHLLTNLHRVHVLASCQLEEALCEFTQGHWACSRVPGAVWLPPPEIGVHGCNPIESFHSFFSVKGENLSQS